MRKLYGILSSAAVLMLMAPVALADIDNDPAFFEDGSGCAPWCAGSGLKLDPLDGITTEAYQLNTTYLPSVTSGDVLINEFGTTTVGDVIRFETISDKPYAFIYSSDTNGGLAADVGLPGSYQANHVTITENANGLAVFTPTTGQPGYAPGAVSPYRPPTYGLTSADVAPEPAFTYVIGAFLLVVGVGGAFRRRRLQ